MRRVPCDGHTGSVLGCQEPHHVALALGKRVGEAFIQCWACGRQVSALSQEEGLTASAFGGEEALLSFGAELTAGPGLEGRHMQMLN